jgi:predicted ATP-grasp superfamily ATP-dependent carboligase
LVCVEFKQDERDGRLKLIECNARFTDANEQVRVAGIDLALIAYNGARGLPLPTVDSFRDHLAMWFPLEDLRALREYRRHGELTTAAWLKTLAHRQALSVFWWRDLKPSSVIWRENASLLTRKVARYSRPAPTQAAVDQHDPYQAAR